MNLNILRYVAAVDEEKSFTRAAQKLYVSQPSLSQSIRMLEKQMGVLLFDREKTPLGLTAEGEVFLEWAKITLHSEDRMLARMAAVSGGIRRKLTAGISSCLSKNILPEALEKFCGQTGNCLLSVVEQPYRELLGMLNEGKIDLMVDTPQQDTVQYTSIHLMTERLFLAADKKFRFGTAGPGEFPSVSLNDLADKPFIVLDPSMYLGAVMRSFFAEFDAAPDILMECQSVETACLMVEAKTGISLIPELFLKYHRIPEGVCCYTVEGMPLTRDIAVVYRNDRRLSEDERLLTDILAEQFSVRVL